MRRGNESDFDPDKMHPGEWAVSLDTKYVRMCFAPGVCIRMATYDAFEADVAKIQGILEEVQTIEEAVTRINTEISEKANAVAEYTEQAKGYRDETKQFRDGAETSATNAKSSEDKAKVSETNAKVSEINAKISEENAQRVAESLPEDYTELSKAFYNTAIKQKAVGDNIHVTDSAEARNVEFGLYGKAEQKQNSGKNLYPHKVIAYNNYGIVVTNNDDGTFNASGTATIDLNLIQTGFSLPVGTYKIVKKEESANLYIKLYNQTQKKWVVGNLTTAFQMFEITDNADVLDIRMQIEKGSTVNVAEQAIMICSSTVTDSTYEPFTNGASPNPDYPQEITVAGASGSVEVVSCRKNLYNELTLNKKYSYGGVTLTKDAETGNLTISGTATASNNMIMNPLTLPAGTYYYQKGNVTNCGVALYNRTTKEFISKNRELSFTLTEESTLDIRVQTDAGKSPSGTIKIQIEKGSAMTEYEPYTETTSTIPTPNGLAGIKVSSGGNYTDENGQQWICDEVVKYADGSGKNIQRIQKAVFDDTSGWVLNGDKTFIYTSRAMSDCAVLANTVKPNLISNYGFAFSRNNLYGSISNGVSISNVGSPSLKIKGCTTLEEYLAYLSNTPLQIVAEITTEPIITDLTAEEIAEIEKLHTFYPITNISNDSDCGMAVTYMADAKNYIDNRLALLETALVNSI